MDERDAANHADSHAATAAAAQTGYKYSPGHTANDRPMDMPKLTTTSVGGAAQSPSFSSDGRASRSDTEVVGLASAGQAARRDSSLFESQPTQSSFSGLPNQTVPHFTNTQESGLPGPPPNLPPSSPLKARNGNQSFIFYNPRPENQPPATQFPPTSPISSFDEKPLGSLIRQNSQTSINPPQAAAPPTSSLFKNQSSSSLGLDNRAAQRGSSLFRSQSNTNLPSARPQLSDNSTKRPYSSLFASQSSSVSQPYQNPVKRPRTLTAPAAFQPTAESKANFLQKIYPKLSSAKAASATKVLRFLNQRIASLERLVSLADSQVIQIDNQIALLRRQSITQMPAEDQSRLESLQKSKKVTYVQRSIHSRNFSQAKMSLESVYKGDVSDYDAYLQRLTRMAEEEDGAARRAVEQLSLAQTRSSSTSSLSTMNNRHKSLFSQESLRSDEFGPPAAVDRAKLEKLLNAIQNDSISDERPEDRVGTPEGLKITLLEHQKVGLNWMKRMEAGVKGGILGDDMGLGKTIQMMCVLPFLSFY